MLTILFRLYHDDPVFNPLTPWERPPIKNVFCIYGAHLKTEVWCILNITLCVDFVIIFPIWFAISFWIMIYLLPCILCY